MPNYTFYWVQDYTVYSTTSHPQQFLRAGSVYFTQDIRRGMTLQLIMESIHEKLNIPDNQLVVLGTRLSVGKDNFEQAKKLYPKQIIELNPF